MTISLRKKILLLFLGLIAISSVATLSSVLFATNNNVEIQAREKLTLGLRVFQQLFDNRGNQLFDSAELLVADFGFKGAVASGDKDTIASALQNNRKRIRADLMMQLSLDGELIAAIGRGTSRIKQFPFPQLMRQANDEGGILTVALLDQRIYQLVMLPVEAPVPIAWTLIGKHIDQQFAGQLKQLTNLEITFAGYQNALQVAHITTVSEKHRGDSSMSNMQENQLTPSKTASGEEFLNIPAPLVSTDSYTINAQLSSSLTAAYAQFSTLKVQIISIASVALLLSAIVAFLIARNVTQPIAELATAMERISSGNYQQPLTLKRSVDHEIRVLSDSFSQMQNGIALREDQLRYQAYHDQLTQLANRVLINDELSKLLAAKPQHLTVVRININQFTQVNDTFGYDLGDHLLKAIAKILLDFNIETNRTGRISADEFVVILPQLNHQQAEQAADTLLQRLQQPLPIDKVNLQVSVRMGLALAPEHGDQSEPLLRRAEVALNSAQRKKQAIVTYQIGQEEDHLRQIKLVNDLKVAIEQDQLSMYYQPKVDSKLNRVTQAEALIRWTHADFGFVSPEEFIGLAEQSGLMPQLTRWVLQTVVKQAKTWIQQSLDIVIAINLSAYDIVESFPSQLQQLLQKTQLNPDKIILEITESAVMENPEQAINVLNQLKQLGFKLSIDDYGTGYSSLTQLKNLPVDELKIDKSFVMNLTNNKDDQVIVKSTIELGHNIGMSIVAEGVENEDCYKQLQQWGCDKLQGYYISRPLPVDDFAPWLQRYHASLSARKQG